MCILENIDNEQDWKRNSSSQIGIYTYHPSSFSRPKARAQPPKLFGNIRAERRSQTFMITTYLL